MRTVEEAGLESAGFDYVFVCIKALPDIYQLGEVIKPVVTPSHTCIIVNTTTALGIEADLSTMYPRNMVLSLCSGIEVTQTGPADFDHTSSSLVYIGALSVNPSLPEEAQQDMTESLTLTLEAGAVECVSTNNIEKYQWEKMIGMIAFHPISVILKEPNHAKLAEDQHVYQLIEQVVDECIRIAEARRATFSYDFKTRSIAAMVSSKEIKSTMYQDFLAGRPLEIEVFLGTPIKFAELSSIPTPNLKSLYALLKHINTINQQKPPATVLPQAGTRLLPQHTGQSMMSSGRPPMQRGFTDGNAPNGNRAMSMVYGPPPSSNPSRGPYIQQRRAPQQLSRQESLEGLEEFASVAMYNELVPAHDNRGEIYTNGRQIRPQPSRASTTQGYYAPNQRAPERVPQSRNGTFSSLSKKMSSMKMSGRGKGRGDYNDDDDDDDDYIDAPIDPRTPQINPEQVDMLAMTRRGRHSALGFRGDGDRTASFANGRQKPKTVRSSSQAVIDDIPGVHDTVTNSVLFGMGDNRYGTVDSRSLAKSANSGRLNSMQSERLNSMSHLQQNYGPGAGPGNQIYRQNGPPNTMQNRGQNANMPYRGAQHYNHPGAGTMRAAAPSQALQRQQLMAQSGVYPVKSSDPNIVNGTRSVTGSASASFGSLGNGSGSHSSSSSRDELPPIPPK